MTAGIYIDMGSTNTRVWLMRDREIIASARAQAGVADSARDGSTQKIRQTLKSLIAELRVTPDVKPSFVIGVGMITSSLGLAEVPHVAAPAGEAELAASLKTFEFPEIVDLPFFLVPGVRNVAEPRQAPHALDIMRGEETLCVGLWRNGLLESNSTLLNLGSHWKAIALNDDGRIASSVTSLSGELLQAARAQTILAGSVPRNWPDELNQQSVEAGLEEQRQSGLPRALFCVRLLEQSKNLSPAEAFAFLCGVFIGADLENLLTRQILRPGSHVAISGSHALGLAWQRVLTQHSIRATLLQEGERERAFLSALHHFAHAKQS